jgi:hypothetical protein
VLLYPDAIGIDLGAIERSLCSADPAPRLVALNGRGRIFALDGITRRRLANRRVLETVRPLEWALLPIFLLLTPVLLLWDLARGRG